MWRPPLAFVAAAMLAVGGCAADGPGGTDDGLRAVAGFYPLEFVASEVGGEHVSVTPLAPPGVEAHDLELTPSQVAELSRADLVVFLRGFQPAVDAAVDAHAAERGFDVGTAVPLLTAAGPDDDHGGTDPHLWLDPMRLAAIADEVADRFAALDPAHRADYLDNAAALRDRLTALDAEYAQGLAECRRREIVVSHAAFGYLADRYDLRQVAVTGLSPETEPNPGRLAEVISQAQRYGATTIFFEVLVSPDVAELIAAQVGARTAVLDPIEGLSPASGDDYFSLMRANLDALRTALDCS